MSEQATKTVKQITGVCESIEEKNGWFAFSINTGSQYPTRVATKLEKLIADARGVGQQTATWTYSEVESDKINEKSGKPYINRYLDKVEVTSLGDLHIKADGHQPPTQGEKDRLIARQTCLKVAGQVFSGALNSGESVDEVSTRLLSLAHELELWLYRDIDEVPFA